jgi:hypothetical protein
MAEREKMIREKEAELRRMDAEKADLARQRELEKRAADQ